ncbi:MAG: hypothetical protein M3362_28050 [Acidobacteriota bacterium]|nr:hypothetical protein [Acidobacteriota bacterium]
MASTAAINGLAEQGMKALRELDPVMRNLFTDDQAALAAWDSASHVARPTRRKKADATAAHAPSTQTQKPSGSS